MYSSLVWENQPARGKILVSSVEDRIQHGLIEQKVSHPLGDDYVDLVNGELDFLHLALNQGNFIIHVVDFDNLTGFLNYRRHVDGVHMLCASMDCEPVGYVVLAMAPEAGGVCGGGGGVCKHAENGCPASYIQHNLVPEQVLVLVDCILV